MPSEPASSPLERDAAWDDKSSLAEYYRPLRFLLDPQELEIARHLSQGTPDHWKKFRRQRIRAFRAFLRDMRLDFRRLEFKLRYLLLAASSEHAPMVTSLNRLKAEFMLGMCLLEMRLLLFSFGVGSIDASGLLRRLEQLETGLTPSLASPSS